MTQDFIIDNINSIKRRKIFHFQSIEMNSKKSSHS